MFLCTFSFSIANLCKTNAYVLIEKVKECHSHNHLKTKSSSASVLVPNICNSGSPGLQNDQAAPFPLLCIHSTQLSSGSGSSIHSYCCLQCYSHDHGFSNILGSPLWLRLCPHQALSLDFATQVVPLILCVGLNLVGLSSSLYKLKHFGSCVFKLYKSLTKLTLSKLLSLENTKVSLKVKIFQRLYPVI